MWPQIVYIVLAMIGLGVVLARFGESRVETYGWSDLLTSSVIAYILYAGGFFNPILK